ncbi:MAG: amidohydrolase family protein [Lentisphaerae bacterium]|nr:amidohydrolase family protein [Lentisphaerota bacterium]
MKIDHHVHSDSDDPQVVRKFISVLEENETIACLSGGHWRGDHTYPGNKATLRIAREYPDWVVPFAWINLWHDNDLAEVDRLIDQGFRGFKFIAPWYEYDHDLYMPIYEKLEPLGYPALFHTGHYRPSPTQATPDFRRPLVRNMQPLTLDRIARSFPKLPIIMAHLGTTLFRQQGAQLVRSTPNIYADLAGCGSWGSLSRQDLEELFVFKYCYGSTNAMHKLMLGSDAYINHPEIIPEAQKYYSQIIPEEFQDKVFGGNIAPWLGIKIS